MKRQKKKVGAVVETVAVIIIGAVLDRENAAPEIITEGKKTTLNFIFLIKNLFFIETIKNLLRSRSRGRRETRSKSPYVRPDKKEGHLSPPGLATDLPKHLYKDDEKKGYFSNICL